VKQRLPWDLVKPCPRPLNKSASTTGVIVERLQHAEAALAACSAQVDGARVWNEERDAKQVSTNGDQAGSPQPAAP
jgi:poly-gamma-glutamate capsule biosynthesis protein CapA/YwtB (metallophosphatase superfamily)